MKKIPKKYASFLNMLLMSIFMAFIMTGVVTAINFNGFPADYLEKWMNAFSKMVFIAFAVILIVRPVVEKIVKKIID